jgi:hypothetical protein
VGTRWEGQSVDVVVWREGSALARGEGTPRNDGYLREELELYVVAFRNTSLVRAVPTSGANHGALSEFGWRPEVGL